MLCVYVDVDGGCGHVDAQVDMLCVDVDADGGCGHVACVCGRG